MDPRVDHLHHEVTFPGLAGHEGDRPSPNARLRWRDPAPPQSGHFGRGWPLLLLILLACTDNSGPTSQQPPYLAIITRVSAGPANEVGHAYRYHIRELSGTIGIDTILTVAPRDTVILPVKPATYVVSLDDVPSQCRIREGSDQAVQVPDGINTAIVRYLVSCQSQLMLTTATDGFHADSFFVWHLRDSRGEELTGLLRSTDTVRINGLHLGKVTVELAQLSDGCVVTSDEGDTPHLVLDSLGGASHEFRVICSDPATRPVLLDLKASYHDGAAGVLFHLYDPDRNPDRYYFDLTDCHRKSLLSGPARFRRGLDTGPTAGRDTVTALAAFELGLPADSVRRACALVYVADYDGNLSDVIESPLVPVAGRAPTITRLDARFNGTQSLFVQVAATDGDNDLAGIFGAAILRDGTIGPPDNHSDVGAYNGIGYAGLALPQLTVGGNGLGYESFLGVIVYVFDQAGHFTRAEDDDLFQ